LGHRYEKKFLSGKDRAIETVYQKLNGQEYSRKVELKEKKPAIGDKVEHKGKTYKVTGFDWGRGGTKIKLEQEGNPTWKGSTNLEGWEALNGGGRNVDKDPDYKGFVSDYAKSGGPKENFAEMFAFYAMGRLPILQKGLFEELVF
jgi:hypothetical protein